MRWFLNVVFVYSLDNCITSMAANMFRYFVLSTLFISLAKGDFSFRLKYCSLKCGCGLMKEKESNKPTDFYWRDFYGTIPPDAFPMGAENQSPQTYVGLVFDPTNNGTFVTTIVEGLDYVYNANNGEVVKKTKRIQILCTMEPERFVWMALTAANVSSLSDYLLVKAGHHFALNNKGVKALQWFFVVKLRKCKIAYASSTLSLNGEVEYAAMDGTLQKSEEKLFLLYKKKKTQSEKGKDTTGNNKPFISHYYKYKIKAGSIIPAFYKQINVGSCSVTCTNEGMNKKKEQDPRSINAMKYYWKPNVVLNEKEAILVGKHNNKSEYVGQAYIILNWLDVGSTRGDSVTIGVDSYSITESQDVHTLSSDHPEKFEWISTNSDDFATLDKANMIPGGEMDNGTQSVVGRELVPTPSATSIRLFGSAAYSYSVFGAYKGAFDVLMLKDDKKE